MSDTPTVAQTNREALYEIMQLLGDEYESGYIGNYERWGDETTSGVPKNVKDESKQDRKGKHEEKKAFFEYLYADLKKVEEGQFGAGQRGLGHDGGSKQGSGQSAQITPVKVEVEVTSPGKEKEKKTKSI